ncbi:hypothetical protein CHS0354_020145 [Potamilus streckersoni]|uniref:Uncharacterized protein n=1 Tax=Potamilus streckersoni TaxID=2493646 RepID=A0AAE0S5J4_9BIVA|nr:hypothetical protein CHS0354_020145 [Potamilus streckersoni]
MNIFQTVPLLTVHNFWHKNTFKNYGCIYDLQQQLRHFCIFGTHLNLGYFLFILCYIQTKWLNVFQLQSQNLTFCDEFHLHTYSFDQTNKCCTPCSCLSSSAA